MEFEPADICKTKEKRERNEREREHLQETLKELDKQKRQLDRLRQRQADGQFYPKLRKLEGADFDSPFNFVWSIDFPIVFTGPNRGFDIVVGNPPFVTARNKIKRDLWAERWPQASQ